MEGNKHISPGRKSFFHYGHRCSVHDAGRTVYPYQSWCQQGTKLFVHGGWGEVSTNSLYYSTEKSLPLETCKPKSYTNRHRHCQHYLYNHPYHPYQGNCQQTENAILPKPLWKDENSDSYIGTAWQYRDSAQNKSAMDESAFQFSGDKQVPYFKEGYRACPSAVLSQPTERRKRCHSEADLDNRTSESAGVQQIYSFDDSHLLNFRSQDADHESIADSLEVLCIEALDLSDADSSGSDADVSRSASTIPGFSVSDIRQDFDDTDFGTTFDDKSRNTDSIFNNGHYQQTRALDDPYSLDSLFRLL